MSLRQLVTAASTIVVAIVLAISVPVSQLRTVSIQIECCCPDREHCKCPDHKPDTRPEASMRACHKSSEVFVSPVLSAFVAPAEQIAVAPVQVAIEVELPLTTPHPAPAPRRPDAPS